mgnify:CR=1 FL=1
MSYGEEDFSVGSRWFFYMEREDGISGGGDFLYEGELSFIFLLYSSKREVMSLTKL